MTSGPHLYIDRKKAAFFKALGYTPYGAPGEPGQYAFHAAASWYRFVSWFAGARGGKSQAASKEAAYRLVVYPKQKIWLAGPNYELTSKEFTYVWEDVFENLRRAGLEPKVISKSNRAQQGNLHIRLDNGSLIECKTCENPDSLLGEEVDLLILCEGAKVPESAYRTYLNYRISSRVAQVLIPTTPAGVNWVHDEFHQKGLEAAEAVKRGVEVEPGELWLDWWQGGRPFPPKHRPRIGRQRWTQITAANLSPYYSEEEYLRHKDEDSADDFEEQVMGRFVFRTGLVLSEFRPGKNIVPGAEVIKRYGWIRGSDGYVRPPDGWTLRIVGMDFGVSKPKATLVGAIHPEREVVVFYWEWYESNMLIRDQCRAVRQHLGPLADHHTTRWIVDRSAPIPEYHEEGCLVRPSASTVNRKNELIAHWNAGCKQSKILVIEEQCPHLVKESKRFVWKADPKVVDGDERDRVRKKDDHAIDAALYAYEDIWMEIKGPQGPSPVVEEQRPWPPPRYDQQPLEQMQKTWLDRADTALDMEIAMLGDLVDRGRY